MIRKIADPILFEKIELDSWSFTCDTCGVLVGTCFDFGFNDDHAVAEKKVKQSVIYCGHCKLDDVDE